MKSYHFSHFMKLTVIRVAIFRFEKLFVCDFFFLFGWGRRSKWRGSIKMINNGNEIELAVQPLANALTWLF